MGETHDENGQTPDGTEAEAGAGEGRPVAHQPAEPRGEESGAAGAETVAPESEVAAGGDVAAVTAEEAAAAVDAEAVAEAAAAAAAEKVRRTKEVVVGLLERLGVQADVEVQDGPEAIVCNLQVRAGGDLFATGPRGQVLEAAQYLVNKLVNRDAEGRKWINLELGGSRPAEPDPAVERMALRLGEAARRMGKTLTVVPMQAKDRRRVHVALAAAEGVETRSEGDGLFRRLLVEPKR